MYRFSINTQPDLRVNSHYGYGKSLIEIKKSIRKININKNVFLLEHNSPRSKVQMHYGPHPFNDSHYIHQYKIFMSQTESDRLEAHKAEIYRLADEFWTASEWGAQAAIRSGVPQEKVFVYHHGLITDDYPAKRRGVGDKIRFLHIDSGSPRKRSDLVEEAFNILYQKNKNIELTLKYSHFPHSGKNWNSEEVLASSGEWAQPGLRRINETLSQREIISLMHYHDVLVYPSEGEGFGLIPLEAMATGMPVISTYEWSPYSIFFPEGHLASDIKPSEVNWGYDKVGNAVITSVDSVVQKMEYFIENIDKISETFFSRSAAVKKEFSWDNKTQEFFTKFVERNHDLLVA